MNDRPISRYPMPLYFSGLCPHRPLVRQPDVPAGSLVCVDTDQENRDIDY